MRFDLHAVSPAIESGYGDMRSWIVSEEAGGSEQRAGDRDENSPTVMGGPLLAMHGSTRRKPIPTGAGTC